VYHLNIGTLNHPKLLASYRVPQPKHTSHLENHPQTLCLIVSGTDHQIIFDVPHNSTKSSSEQDKIALPNDQAWNEQDAISRFEIDHKCNSLQEFEISRPSGSCAQHLLRYYLTCPFVL
jgi:hypothetical protein